LNDKDDMKRLDPNAESDLRLTEEGMTIVEPPRRMTTGGGRGRLSLLVLGAGLILIGLNLRIGVASVGPVLGDVLGDTGLRAAVGPLPTPSPVFAFGAVALRPPALTRRVGMHRVLGILMVVLAAGIGLRLQPSLLALVSGTVLVGAAIAVGNVL